MRKALIPLVFAVALPASARAEEPAPNVKLGKMEELGAVTAAIGGVALGAGGILLGMGLDRRLAPGEVADEIYIATGVMISGALLLGVGIPLAIIGHAKYVRIQQEAEKQGAWLVPTLGGAAAVVRF